MTIHGERMLALFGALLVLMCDATVLIIHFGFTLADGVSINWPALVAVNAIVPLLVAIEMIRKGAEDC